jgi:hypothetical protein
LFRHRSGDVLTCGSNDYGDNVRCGC